MEVSTGRIRIETKKNILPTNMQMLGVGMDGYLIFKYNIGDKMHYTQYYPDRKLQTYLFFEII